MYRTRTVIATLGITAAALAAPVAAIAAVGSDPAPTTSTSTPSSPSATTDAPARSGAGTGVSELVAPAAATPEAPAMDNDPTPAAIASTPAAPAPNPAADPNNPWADPHPAGNNGTPAGPPVAAPPALPSAPDPGHTFGDGAAATPAP